MGRTKVCEAWQFQKYGVFRESVFAKRLEGFGKKTYLGMTSFVSREMLIDVQNSEI